MSNRDPFIGGDYSHGGPQFIEEEYDGFTGKGVWEPNPLSLNSWSPPKYAPGELSMKIDEAIERARAIAAAKRQ